MDLFTNVMQYQQLFIFYLQTITNLQRSIYAPWHIFLCKKLACMGPHIFMNLKQILMKLHISPKFGMINQAMMLFFVGMKKSEMHDFGKKVHW